MSNPCWPRLSIRGNRRASDNNSTYAPSTGSAHTQGRNSGSFNTIDFSSLNDDQLLHLHDLQDALSMLEDWGAEQAEAHRRRQPYPDSLHQFLEAQIEELMTRAREDAQAGPPSTFRGSASRLGSIVSTSRSNYGAGSPAPSSRGSGLVSSQASTAPPPYSSASSRH